MTRRFENKVALITGSGRGMGYTDAELMAKEGASIIVQDIDAALVRDATEKLQAMGAQVYPIVSDVADVQTTQAKIGEAENHFGRIDVLVNNAGVGGGGTLEEATEEIYYRIFDIHVKGSLFATQAVIPGMKERRGGAIVNVSSIWGMTGYPSNSEYCGAKAALLGLTKAWAKELVAWGIRVNAVAPGSVLTEMTLSKGAAYIEAGKKRIPLGRWAQPEEMCQAVLFLASEQASFITGQCLSPNGGDTIVGI